MSVDIAWISLLITSGGKPAFSILCYFEEVASTMSYVHDYSALSGFNHLRQHIPFAVKGAVGSTTKGMG